jgi:hypothetical protein
MYTKYLTVKPSQSGGKGTFTTIQIPAKAPIMEIRGSVFTVNTIPDKDSSNYLQIGPNTFLGPSGGVDDYLNHSCNPNCMVHVVGTRAILYSLYVIPIGAELTFDYACTSTDTPETWKMECKCGQFNCRNIISGFSSLSPELQEQMKAKGLVPLYISEPTMFK